MEDQMKTGDWLKLSIFALVGVVISLVILGLNSKNNQNNSRNAYSNYPNMQGYVNAGYYPDQFRTKRIAQKNEPQNTMQMQGENGYSNNNGIIGDYNQTAYLPSQLMAMNYQMINNDVYMQKEIVAIQQHDARLHNEVQELQGQYGQLKQGLANVYTALNGQNQNYLPKNAGMQMSAPAQQYMQTSMGFNGMGNMNPAQNQYGTGYYLSRQNQPYPQNGMNGMNQMQSQPGANGMNSMQNSGMTMGMGMMDKGMNMGMDMMDNMMDNMMGDMMMMKMMNMMDDMMMNNMQNSGNGMSSGNSGSGGGGSMSSGSGSSGSGMGMM
jgi:uncharacterized membrane protein YgcG